MYDVLFVCLQIWGLILGWHFENGAFKHGDTEPEPNRVSDRGAHDGAFIFLDPLGLPAWTPTNANSSSASWSPSAQHSHHMSEKDARLRATEVSVMLGEFCLISTENSESALAILFYGYMFLLWLLLLILVVFFYSRVGRAMFLLRNIHDKMFSLNDRAGNQNFNRDPSRRSCTPRTASLAQENDHYEYNAQYHNHLGFKGKGHFAAEGVVLLSHEVLKSVVNNEENGVDFLKDVEVSSTADLQTNNEQRSEVQQEEGCAVLTTEQQETNDDMTGTGNSSQNVSRDSVNTVDSDAQQTDPKSKCLPAKHLQVSEDSVYETGSGH
ncbi:hypothetical protein ElyMa_001392900 [Elysia marginata]|uniref:Uncharacterized protein n=1 Tax=Elysia marginata TaxID=1093978 RepID=A0AAV4IS74_9GAST|nr:hypothetical protein ElyMa_001392900 [Elysia marginata]